MKIFLFLAPLLLCTACASTRQGGDQHAKAVATDVRPGESRTQQVGSALTAPLSDFNLIQTTIPPVLMDAQNNPYRVSTDDTCASIEMQVVALDAVLGSDLDKHAEGNDPSAMDKGVSAAENASISALRRTTEGVIPFRGWVRKLTGAERHSEKVLASIAAGTIRRGFLKGVGYAKGCQYPAAPLPPLPPAVVTPVPKK
ncbi:hypothetical protein [Undibacterium sp. RuTC16W]|uniref:hypothetical protein n=1 Tax=Undibacterium sp. RuTC16W TaxID=3413048 RepID=UPI003BF14521